MDKNLVAGVRDMLVAFPLEYRVFSRLKRAQIGADIPPFTRGRRGRPGRRCNVFERASGEPLTKGIPGLFTQGGLSQGASRRRSTRRPASSPPRRPGCSACGRPDASRSLPTRQGEPRADQPGAAPVLRGVHQDLGQVHRRRARGQARQPRAEPAGRAPALRRRFAAGARSCAAWRARRPWSRPRPRSARRAAPRSATSTRRPSRPSARWPRCWARSRCRAPTIAATGPPLETHGRRSLRADPPPRHRHAAADRRDA